MPTAEPVGVCSCHACTCAGCPRCDGPAEYDRALPAGPDYPWDDRPDEHDAEDLRTSD